MVLLYERQESEYELEKAKRSNIKIKVRFIALFVVFALAVFFLMKNGYSLDFTTVIGGNEIVFHCADKHRLRSGDDEELRLEKARGLLNDNIDRLEVLEGFSQANIGQEPIGYKGKRIVVIGIEFEGEVKTNKKIPEELCGFKTAIIYR